MGWGRIKGLKLQRFGKLNFTYHGKLQHHSRGATVDERLFFSLVYCGSSTAALKTPEKDFQDLQALTLVGPPRDNPEIDPLAVLHLDNCLYMSPFSHMKIQYPDDQKFM